MATGEYYSVPEINPTTATPDKEFGSCILTRRSMEKAAWAGEQFGDLARRRPEELPPYFLSVSEALSPVTGWTTEHGWWEPKDSFVQLCELQHLLLFGTRVRTTLVFRPKDGSKSDLAMTLYNTINRLEPRGPLLEEDMTVCHVFRVPRKRKGVVHIPLMCKSQSGYADYPEISELDAADIPDFRLYEMELPKVTQGNGAGGWDPHSFGAPKKRQRSKPPVGGSDVWHTFAKIYTKDPKVMYGACLHCGRMMKLKGGSSCGTSSLSKHKQSLPVQTRQPYGHS